MNEVDLVKKAKLGDVKSFCALYDIYKKKLYNYAFFNWATVRMQKTLFKTVCLLLLNKYIS